MGPRVRAIYGASLSPDATAFAHIVDDGGYPRAVQRFLRGWRASSSRDVELPVEGTVTRVMHSADGHWLACEVAADGGSRTQIWVVTTDPDDRDARRIDGPGPEADDGTAELIAWDGTQVAAILTGQRRRRAVVPDRPGHRQSCCPGPTVGGPAGGFVGRRVAHPGRAAWLSRTSDAAWPDRNLLAAIRSRINHGCRGDPRRSRAATVTCRRRGRDDEALPAGEGLRNQQR